MATVDGLILAKLMERLGEQTVSDLDDVEFDDGVSDEPVQVTSICRDTIELRMREGWHKSLNRVVAAKGRVIDPNGCLTKFVNDLLGEGVYHRAARLLGDPALESDIRDGLCDLLPSAEIDRLVVLPDHAMATLARVALGQDPPDEELRLASDVARGFELSSTASAFWKRHTARFLRSLRVP